uniref:Putative secreted protein n=1 Tax=Amblyomma americanum TaxID=6943 RepID=A0A0C9SD69_AMBAM
MRSLMVCLGVLLALAVLECYGEKNSGDEGCWDGNRSYPHGSIRNLTKPCVQVICENGRVSKKNCTEVTVEQGGHYPQEPEREFPHCCPPANRLLGTNRQLPDFLVHHPGATNN